MSARNSFSIATILWLTVCVAAFFAGRLSTGPQILKSKAIADQSRAMAEDVMARMRANSNLQNAAAAQGRHESKSRCSSCPKRCCIRSGWGHAEDDSRPQRSLGAIRRDRFAQKSVNPSEKKLKRSLKMPVLESPCESSKKGAIGTTGS